MEKKRVLVTCHDIGPTNALIPVIKHLVADGHEVTVLTETGAPARTGFASADIAQKSPIEFEAVSWSKEDMVCICRSLQPHTILAGFDFFAQSVLLAGEQHGIPTSVLAETWPHRSVAVYGGAILEKFGLANRVFVPDDASRDILVSIGFLPERVVVAGNPSHEYLAEISAQRKSVGEAFRKRLGIPEDVVLVAWLMTLDLDDPTIDDPNHPEWLGTAEAEVVAEFLTALREVRGGPVKVRGVIRQKPSYRRERVLRLISELNPEVAFDVGTEMRGLPILMASDIALGMATTMLQTAAFCGIPGVYYTPKRGRPDDMISNEIGLTKSLVEEKGLDRIIRRLADGSTDAINELRPGITTPLAMDASRRIADALPFA